jgi:hypothetical protein
MSRGMAFTLAASLAINLVLAAIGRGSFVQSLAVVLIIPIALILLCIGSLIFRFGGASPGHRRLAMRAIAFGLVAGNCFISLPIGWLVNRYDIEQAKSFCNRLRPELERHRYRTGRYPEQLPPASAGGRLPRLLKDSEFYHSFKDFYVISFGDPSGIFNGFEYDSRDGAWSEWD